MSPRSIASLLAICVCTLRGQQPAPAVSSTAKSSQSDAPLDSAKLFAAIRASYYHADDLSGLDCGAILDWGALFKQLGQPVADERIQQLKGMLVQVHAKRGANPSIEFLWQHSVPANKETLESGAKQMLSGFFQMFWAFNDLSTAPSGSDKFLAESQKGGGYTLRYDSKGVKVLEEATNDDV